MIRLQNHIILYYTRRLAILSNQTRDGQINRKNATAGPEEAFFSGQAKKGAVMGVAIHIDMLIKCAISK